MYTIIVMEYIGVLNILRNEFKAETPAFMGESCQTEGWEKAKTQIQAWPQRRGRIWQNAKCIDMYSCKTPNTKIEPYPLNKKWMYWVATTWLLQKIARINHLSFISISIYSPFLDFAKHSVSGWHLRFSQVWMYVESSQNVTTPSKSMQKQSFGSFQFSEWQIHGKVQ